MLKQIQSEMPEQLSAYMDYCIATATNGQYYPFHKFRFKVSKGVEPTLAWHLIREARRRASKPLPGMISKEGQVGSYVLTPEILGAISMIDRHATDGNMESIDKKNRPLEQA
ncbi:hypothetical protein [Endozoicomonas sp. 4G]|uniref:hypothetical protein n=1 Tax=Endozoicomonas sp. 4G TaxID=2872754 RepID=UPI00207908F0|nr:hypothetical protein [Endozoicomonas sp. 4G]